MLQSNKNYLVHLILTINRLTHERLRNEHSKISPVQIIALNFIEANNDPTMKDLAEFLYIAPPSATSLANNLAKAGLIKRLLDEKDRRILRIIITEKGKEMLSNGKKIIVGYIEKNFEALNNKEKKQLTAIAEKILKSILKLNSNPPTGEKK
jgi:DNA-binding MarR family transcriptional regulator